MKNFEEGVPRVGRENNLERQSRGRGRCVKAARTPWRIALTLNNPYATINPRENLGNLLAPP